MQYRGVIINLLLSICCYQFLDDQSSLPHFECKKSEHPIQQNMNIYCGYRTHNSCPYFFREDSGGKGCQSYVISKTLLNWDSNPSSWQEFCIWYIVQWAWMFFYKSICSCWPGIYIGLYILKVEFKGIPRVSG